MIKIIKPGIIIRDKLGIVHDARSTVTLIRNKKNIIVDTGAIGEHKGIINGLKKDCQNLEKARNERSQKLDEFISEINRVGKAGYLEY